MVALQASKSLAADAALPLLQELCVAARAASNIEARRAGAVGHAAPPSAVARLQEAAAAEHAPLASLLDDELVEVLRAFSHMQLADERPWRTGSAIFSQRVPTASVQNLAVASNAFAHARVSHTGFLRVACQRTEELILGCASEQAIHQSAIALDVRATAILLKALPLLGAEVGSNVRAAGSGSVARLSSEALAVVEATWAAQAAHMSFDDVVRALDLFARLSHPAPEFLCQACSRVLDVLGACAAQGAAELPETFRLLQLVESCVRLGHRDDKVLDAVLGALVAKGAGRDAVPGHRLPRLVWSLTSRQLRPPPPSLVRLLEMRLPSSVREFRVSDLEVVGSALAFVPGIPETSPRLGHAVFKACLVAPLSAMRPPALVGILRSAWEMRYVDPDFWTSALRLVERSLLDHGADWPTKKIALAALIAARVLAVTSRSEPSPAGSISAVAQPPRAKVRAAEGVVLAAAAVAEPRANELSPRDIGMLAIAHAKAKLDNGSFFAAMAHRSMELLVPVQPLCSAPGAGRRLRQARSHKVSFGKRDVAQILAALATFSYREDVLLAALASVVQQDWDEYDAVAKDIALWAIFKLGGLPEASHGQSWPDLSDALLEYELSKGRKEVSERARDHLLSAEVFPAED